MCVCMCMCVYIEREIVGQKQLDNNLKMNTLIEN